MAGADPSAENIETIKYDQFAPPSSFWKAKLDGALKDDLPEKRSGGPELKGPRLLAIIDVMRGSGFMETEGKGWVGPELVGPAPPLQ
jgi:hypothetical protein